MAWLEHLSYAGILLALLAAGLGVPIPEDIPLLTAGYLCHHGRASLVIMLPLAFLGVLAGDCILFSMGRRFGDQLLEHRLTRRLFRRKTLDSVIARYHQHGAKIIFAGRFMPGMRAMIFAAAGVVGIPWWKFVAVNGGAALISVPALVMLGYYFGTKSAALFAEVRHAQHYIAAALVLVTVVAVAVEWYLNRRPRRNGPVDVAPVEPRPVELGTFEAEPIADKPVCRSGPVSPRQPTAVE